MIDFELLRQHVAKYIQLSATEFETFITDFHPRKINKKNFLLREGEICKYEAFVTKGCFRIYYLDENGDAQILYFAVETWWATDIDSFIHQRPSILNIEALEDTTVLVISKTDKDKLYEALPKVEKMFRIMNQHSLVTFQRRVISSLGKTAEQRYLEFVEKYPALEQRLTQQQLAAYLGISHEFLSKIRKRLSRR
ncbi:Crp/Fnr family transcriptional regulator [Chitinophaga sp. Cy-1792]|uniref:Crp/Fnr family transcriptional regulator n=1 Tax=Chitinophaga sp. Cy-1792 TaxID=2608339 RepID=UPI00142109F8|nr:Crp/Fnr family transcriptional regulator [Chitinophaga sp. Cy-1792]NIG55777.1 Crp/Fnr family transcriptional regulator [Chitinophaga sp. Cy-1792]